jgi:subtilase family serine protease
MYGRRFRVPASALAGAGLLLTALTVIPQTAGASTARTALAHSAASSVALAHPAGPLAGSTTVPFELVLSLRDPSGAAALVKAVSDPTSADFRHYVTAAQWEARFSPTTAQVRTAENWLKVAGFKVGAISADRLTISASGTAAQVDKAFDTQLGNYKVHGETLREASRGLSVPASIAGVVSGVLGVNQVAATPDFQDPPPPAAFTTDPPCSSYFGGSETTTTFGNQNPGYPNTMPNTVCGYVGSQLRSAYDIPTAATGAGVTVAIIDAYDSKTIAKDAKKYFAANDPSAPFAAADFTQDDQGPFDDQAVCSASGWQDEEAIDVESAHSLAPDAHIVYVGAQDCENGLFTAEQTVIDSHLADVVSNSWGDTAGDLFDDAATHTAYDNLFMLADATGITVQFSSGDDGDDFDVVGFSSAEYPTNSPYVTSVGGTSLEIGSSGQQITSYGWSTGKSVECKKNVAADFPTTCSKADYGTWMTPSFDGGSGGFTSFYYAQPWYQAPVVPTSLSERNSPLFGPTPMRVNPDISLDADPATGFLIGLTETFPNGTTEYGQTRYGGTSLASPILAGIVADIDQQAGVAVGFLNPALYRLDTTSTTAIQDVGAATDQVQYRNDYVAEIFGSGTGSVHSVRIIGASVPESYCDGTGNCVNRPDTQSAATGYDSLTGLGSLGADFVSDLALGS